MLQAGGPLSVPGVVARGSVEEPKGGEGGHDSFEQVGAGVVSGTTHVPYPDPPVKRAFFHKEYTALLEFILGHRSSEKCSPISSIQEKPSTRYVLDSLEGGCEIRLPDHEEKHELVRVVVEKKEGKKGFILHLVCLNKEGSYEHVSVKCKERSLLQALIRLHSKLYPTYAYEDYSRLPPLDLKAESYWNKEKWRSQGVVLPISQAVNNGVSWV
jgi:hypothetical protein